MHVENGEKGFIVITINIDNSLNTALSMLMMFVAQNLVKEKEVKGESEDGGSDVAEKLEKVKETLLETESRERERTGRERCLRERSPSLHRQVVCRRRKADTNTSSGASTCSEDSDHSNDTFGESGRQVEYWRVSASIR